MRSRKLTVNTTLELDVEVECSVTPGSRAYFDRGWGNWLPGDPPEVEILRVLVNGVDVGTAALGDDQIAAIEEAALEDAGEPDDDHDAAYERSRDARWED